jgi:hypothetical protein
MSVAEKIEKENSDCLRLKAKDNDGGETTYRRMGPAAVGTIEDAAIDFFHPNKVFLMQGPGGAPRFQQAEPGLPDKLVVAITEELQPLPGGNGVHAGFPKTVLVEYEKA